MRTADCGLWTADYGPGVKCMLGVKYNKDHIRGEIREMSSRKQCKNRFYSRNPQTSLTTLSCPAERGKRLTRPDKKHM